VQQKARKLIEQAWVRATVVCDRRLCLVSDRVFTMTFFFSPFSLFCTVSPPRPSLTLSLLVVLIFSLQILQQGVLVHRYQIWLRTSGWSGENWALRMGNSIVSCIILHNLSIRYGDAIDPAVLAAPQPRLAFFNADHFIAPVEQAPETIRSAITMHLMTRWKLQSGIVVRIHGAPL